MSWFVVAHNDSLVASTVTDSFGNYQLQFSVVNYAAIYLLYHIDSVYIFCEGSQQGYNLAIGRDNHQDFKCFAYFTLIETFHIIPVLPTDTFLEIDSRNLGTATNGTGDIIDKFILGDTALGHKVVNTYKYRLNNVWHMTFDSFYIPTVFADTFSYDFTIDSAKF